MMSREVQPTPRELCLLPYFVVRDELEDIKLTQRLKAAGEIIGIDVLDHIIVGDKEYLSLKAKTYFKQ